MNDTPFAKTETKEVLCDVCGKPNTIWAMMWSVTGKYGLKEDAIAPYKINREYHFCYPCFFKKMGVKP
jgi:hypothetical protein